MSAMDTFVVDVETAPHETGLDSADGWRNMQVQFLLDQANAGASRMVVGRTVFPPGDSSHEYHRHPGAEEFVFVLRGEGVVMNGEEEIHVRAGQMVFHPRNIWHGFRNPSETEEVEVLWAWGGAGSKEAAGYEVRTEGDGHHG
jgi:quercetin dioxygenase-like cupin family protein